MHRRYIANSQQNGRRKNVTHLDKNGHLDVFCHSAVICQLEYGMQDPCQWSLPIKWISFSELPPARPVPKPNSEKNKCAIYAEYDLVHRARCRSPYLHKTAHFSPFHRFSGSRCLFLCTGHPVASDKGYYVNFNRLMCIIMCTMWVSV